MTHSGRERSQRLSQVSLHARIAFSPVNASQRSIATWTNVGSAISRYSATAGWAQATVDLSAYKGQTVYLAFVGISAYGNDVHLDDVTVTGQ